MNDKRRETMGTLPLVEGRPDLKAHLVATMTAVSTPASNESDVSGRGELPPEGKKGPENAHPWKPIGRK